MSRYQQPPGPKLGYGKGSKGGRPPKVKTFIISDDPNKDSELREFKQERPNGPWRFKKFIRLDWSKIDSRKVNVIYAGSAKRLRNRLRNHPIHEHLNEAKDVDFEIWVWSNPKGSIEATLRSGKPDMKLTPSEFRKAPDAYAVYVWVAKPKRKP